MKTHFIRLRALFALTVSVMLLIFPQARAAILYWDGLTPAGAPGGGAGNWDTTLTNWDNTPSADSSTAWVNANLDTAVFGGALGAVALGSNIDVGGLQFNTTGYGITTTGFTLNFADANNIILFNNIAAASITGPVGGAGNVILTASNPATAGILTLNGTSAGGWTGTTTINLGMTMALAGSNQALLNTSGITLNGGGITLTNINNTEGALDRVNNAAGITSNGGTITYTNTIGGTAYAETLGTVALTSGQLNIVSTNQVTSGTQTLTLGSGSLTHAAANTSAITFAGTSLGANARNSIIVTGQSTTAVGGIIGPWATWGSTAAAQTDYAAYNITNGTTNAFGIQNANIAATAENSGSWVSGANVTLSGAANLTGTRTLNTVRYTGAAATLDLGGSNFSLQTYGLLNGGAGLTISTNANNSGILGTGGLTTPTGGGNLYLTAGNAAITVNAPIIDNGGAVTVVKSGSNTLTLGNGGNNFTGGVVLNAGTLGTTSDAHFGIGGGVTVNGAATWNMDIGGATALTYNRSLTINDGAVLTIASGSAGKTITGVFSGSGTIINPTSTGITFTNLNNTFTGTVNSGYQMDFASLGDGGYVNLIGSNSRFNWTGGAKTFANRVFAIQSTGTGIIDSNGSGPLVIQQNLAITGAPGVRTLTLEGTNTGINTFFGNIADGTSGGASVVSLTKSDNANWALGGVNTYSGATLVNAGGTTGDSRLIFQGMQALSPNTTLEVRDSSSSQGRFYFLDDNGGTSNGSVTSRNTVPLTFRSLQSSANGSTTIFVGNNNTANGGSSAGTATGNTIALGAYISSPQNFGSTGDSVTIAGANGYKLQFASIAFPNLTTKGAATTFTINLNPTTASLIVAGGVTPSGSTTNTNSTPILQLGGTAAGNEINGAIANPSNFPTSNALALTKTGTSTWSLSGTNDYTGTTTVSGGTLLLSSTGSLHASSAVTVSGGAIGGTGTVNGTVSLTTAGGIDLRNGSVGTFALGSTLGNTGAAGANNLFFDLGNGTNTTDKITVAGATNLSATAGSVVIHLNQLGGLAGTGPAPGSSPYKLIQSTGTLTNGASAVLNTRRAFRQFYTIAVAGNDIELTTAAGTAGDAVPNHYWKGSTSVWNTAQWYSDSGATVTDTAPGYSSNVVFAATSPANLTNTLGADFEINSLTVNSGVAATSISGNMLTIDATGDNGNTAGNGITVNNAAGTTIASKVGLAQSQTWTVGTSAALTVSGVVSDFGGGYGLTKAGAGTLTLTGTNTFTGPLAINAGTLSLGTTNGVGLGSPSSVTFTGNSTLLFNVSGGTLTFSTPVAINPGITANFDKGGGGGGGTFTFNDVLSGSGTLSFLSGGSGNGTLNFNSTGNTFTGTVETASTYATNGSTTFNIASIGDGGKIRHAGTAIDLTVNYTGSSINFATRQLEMASTRSLVFNNNGIGTVVFDQNLSVTATGAKTLTLGGTSANFGNVFGGTINDGTSAVISLTKANAGIWTLTNTNGYTGATTISGGTLQLGNGGTTGALTGTASIANNATLTINRSNAFTQATDLNGQIISGTGALNLNGSGNVTLSGSNTYSGATNVNNGTLTLSHNQALQNSALFVNPSATLVLSGTTTPTIGGLNGNTNLSAVSGYSRVTTLTLNPQTGVTASFSGVISDGATGMNLVKSGAGTQIINGAMPTYTGTTTISAGQLQFVPGTQNVFGTNTNTISMANGTSLLFNAGTAPNASAGTSGLGGYVIPNAITLTGASASILTAQNNAKHLFSGNITASGIGTPVTLNFLNNQSGSNTGGDRTTATFSGIISNGSSSALSLALTIRSQTGGGGTNTHPAYANLTGLNTFTGNVTAINGAAGATSWLTIGGERWSDGTGNTPTYGRMGSGRLADNASGVYAGNFIFSSTAANVMNLVYFSSANQTWSGVVGSGGGVAGSLVKEGTGTLTLSNANLYNSFTTIGGGTLRLGFNTTTTNILPTTTPLWMGLGTSYLGVTGQAAMTISGGGGGGTLESGGADNTATYAQTVASLNTAANTTNRIQHSVAAGSGTQTLTVTSSTLTIGANSGLNFDLLAGLANGSTIGTGRVVLTGNTSVTALNSGWTVLDDGGFGLAGTNASNQVIRNTTTAALVASGGSSATNYLTTSSSGNTVTNTESVGSITTDTTGGNVTLTISAAQTLSNNVWNFGGKGSNTALVTGGTGVTSLASGNTIAIHNFNTGSVTFSTPILNNGSNPLVVGGTGTVTLTGLNTYAGATTINSGTLQIGGSGRLNAGTYAAAIGINGGSVLRYSSDQNQTLSGVISGAGGITKDTSSTSDLTLSGTNVYTGVTTVSAGRIVATAVTHLSSGATNLVQSGTGQFYLNAATTFANPISIGSTGYTEIGDSQNNTMAVRMASGGALANTITLSGNSRIGLFSNGSAAITGKITGGYGIDFYGVSMANGGNQTFTISNTGNDYTGNTSIYSSLYNNTGYTGVSTTLRLGASNVITNGASAGNVVFAINGTNPNNSVILDLAGFNEIINGVTVNSGANAIITNSSVGSSILQIGDNNTTSSFGGTITDSGLGKTLAITKIGNGTLTLSGVSNTYTGATNVNAGTLIINGSTSISSLVNIGVNGTLGGTGTVGGNTTISGTHNPGNSPGIQTFTGNLSYVDGGTPDPVVNWELGMNTTVVGVNPTANFDQVIVGGNLDFTNITAINLIFNGAGSSVLWADVLWGSNQSWLLYDVAGTTTNFANLSLNTSDWLDSGSNSFNTANVGSFSLGQSGQDIMLNFTAIPEPKAALLGCLGALLLLRRRRN